MPKLPRRVAGPSKPTAVETFDGKRAKRGDPVAFLTGGRSGRRGIGVGRVVRTYQPRRWGMVKPVALVAWINPWTYKGTGGPWGPWTLRRIEGWRLFAAEPAQVRALLEAERLNPPKHPQHRRALVGVVA